MALSMYFVGDLLGCLYAREQVMKFRRGIGFHNLKHEGRFEEILNEK